MTLKKELFTSDNIGAFISTLCIVHCLATPFFFVAHTGIIASHHTSPDWWSSLDFLFIGISFIAVFRSAQNSSKKWMSLSLWLAWFGLFVFIMNEKLDITSIHDYWFYAVGLTLAILHIYNRKHCQCEEDNCCQENK